MKTIFKFVSYLILRFFTPITNYLCIGLPLYNLLSSLLQLINLLHYANFRISGLITFSIWASTNSDLVGDSFWYTSAPLPASDLATGDDVACPAVAESVWALAKENGGRYRRFEHDESNFETSVAAVEKTLGRVISGRRRVFIVEKKWGGESREVDVIVEMELSPRHDGWMEWWLSAVRSGGDEEAERTSHVVEEMAEDDDDGAVEDEQMADRQRSNLAERREEKKIFCISLSKDTESFELGLIHGGPNKKSIVQTTRPLEICRGRPEPEDFSTVEK